MEKIIIISKEDKTIKHCKCGQAVRFRKKDNKWVHYGWKSMNETYKDFLDRTNHEIEFKEVEGQ